MRCAILIVLICLSTSLWPEVRITISEYNFANYSRHTLLEEEDRFQKRGFSFSPGLEIISWVKGMEITLLGERLGNTPWESNALSPGIYNFVISKTGYPTTYFQINLKPDVRMVVVIEAEKQKSFISLKNLPPGYKITVNGNAVDAPEFSVSSGELILEVTAFGWERVRESIFISPNTRLEWIYSGQPAPFDIHKITTLPRVLPTKDTRGFRIGWTVTSPGSGTLTILAKNGRKIFSRPISFLEFNQSLNWIPADFPGISDGVYIVRLSGMGHDGETATAETRIYLDGRFHRMPRSGATPLPGLLYAPGTAMFAPGLGQAFLGGGFALNASIPISIGMRFSPLSRLEFTFRFTENSFLQPAANTFLGFSIASAWRFTSRPTPFSGNLVLAVSYEGEIGQFSRIPQQSHMLMLPGIHLFIPMEYKISNWAFIFSPGLQVVVLGEEALNWSLNLPMRILGNISTGLYFENSMFLAGISIALRSPDSTALFAWTLWSGLDARLTLPGGGSYLSGNVGLKVIPDPITFFAGIEFGVMR